MASSLLTLKRVAAANLKCASTRRFFCSRSPVGEVHSHAHNLAHSLSPSTVALQTFFSGGSGDPKIHDSCRGGHGVLLDPTLIVTSAHAVGRVCTLYRSSTTVEKPGRDRFEKGSVIHKSYIGSTAALTGDGKELQTRPLAVNFGSDVAVLEVVNREEGNLLPHCVLANSLPEKENILMAIARFDLFMGNVRSVREKTVRTKAPWPMEDELEWIEHEWFFFGGGSPPPGSILFNSMEKVTGSVARISGSPWLNLYGEVVGISSWEVRDEPGKFFMGYAVPVPSIRSVLDYAKTKGPEDPIVMDRWVDALVVPGD